VVEDIVVVGLMGMGVEDRCKVVGVWVEASLVVVAVP